MSASQLPECRGCVMHYPTPVSHRYLENRRSISFFPNGYMTEHTEDRSV